MQYNWNEVYLGFYKEPLMKAPEHWFLWVRIQNEDRTKVMCNECWEFFKRLHPKHLNKHWLSIDEYRKKNWFSMNTAMIADQESLKISHKILGKPHAINNNIEALESRYLACTTSRELGKWENSNERQNKYWTCHDQVWDRLKKYIERFWQLPTYASIGEDWKAIYSLLKHRYWDVNIGFKEYWLPRKDIVPWVCVEYTFSDWEIIKVWYKHNNWDKLVEKIKQTSKLFD